MKTHRLTFQSLSEHYPASHGRHSLVPVRWLVVGAPVLRSEPFEQLLIALLDTRASTASPEGDESGRHDAEQGTARQDGRQRHEESFLADLGAPVYDRDYFSDRRYDYLTARSLGHSVPYVNGHEQAVGSEFTARVVQQELSDERDATTFDLAACYPEATGLDALGRTVALDRPSERFTSLTR